MSIDITFDPRNPNEGTKRGRRVVRKSIERLGAGRSVVIDQNGALVSGNKSYDAFVENLERDPVVKRIGEEGWETADVLVVNTEGEQLIAVQRDDLALDADGGRARELAVADNRAAELGLQWDLTEMEEFFNDSLNTAYLFSKMEKESILAQVEEEPPAIGDRTPTEKELDKLQQKWGTAPGQLWDLGQHRLLIADATIPANGRTLIEAINGRSANLCFTSPPYWLGLSYETETSEDDIDRFIDHLADTMAEIISLDNGRIMINTAMSQIHRVDKSRETEVLILVDKYQQALRSNGWLMRHLRIWSKLGHGPRARGGVSPVIDLVQHNWEHIMMFTPEQIDWSYLATFWSPEGEQRGHNRVGENWAFQAVWDDIQGDRSADGKHIAGMPKELAERCIRLYSKENEVVFDPFTGSGTTLVVCERWNRQFIGLERDPKYAAGALQRWHEATTQYPELIA